MSLKESGEMYLESLYVLAKEKASVRSVDLAEHMSFSRASVSRGLGLLKQQGYLQMDIDGFLTLTEAGAQAAERIYERHTVLTKLLQAMGIDETTASEDACRMEHVISDTTFRCLRDYYLRWEQEHL